MPTRPIAIDRSFRRTVRFVLDTPLARLPLLAPLLAALLAPLPACASDFKSIGPRSAVLYDAPSPKGNKLFIAPSGMPVEVLVAYGDWVKVRDAAGDLAWTAAKNLSAKRNVIVRTAGAKIYAAPEDGAAVVMVLDKNVLLELVEPDAGAWARVRHRDGATGYVKASDVWGIVSNPRPAGS